MSRRCARKSKLAFASANPRTAESIMLIGGLAGGGTNFNIVPDEFGFTIDRRPNADEDFDEAKRELPTLLESEREGPTSSGRTCRMPAA